MAVSPDRALGLNGVGVQLSPRRDSGADRGCSLI